MPEFVFQARKPTGEDVAGHLSAATRNEAIALLSGRQLFPLKVEAAAQRALTPSSFGLGGRRVGTELLASTLTQLGDLLDNGVPLLESLKLLSDQTPHPMMQEVLRDVRDQVADGVSLEVALAKHPRVFSSLTISMVRAGMEGAFLEEALRRVSSFLERQEELKAKVTGALAYPIFLAGVGVLVTTVLVVFFVPKFDGLFEQLEKSGTGLPVATIVLLAISDMIKHYWMITLGVMIGGAMLIRQQWQRESVQRAVDRYKLKLPLVGEILHLSAVSRFCRILGTLLRNGVPILKSLEISSSSSGNRLLAEAIQSSASHVSSGESLAKPLAASKLFPPSVMAMITVAEESNSLDTVLVKIADRTDERIERRMNLMVRLIEPIMLVMIGGMVMLILVALLLPIIDASTSIQ